MLKLSALALVAGLLFAGPSAYASSVEAEWDMPAAVSVSVSSPMTPTAVEEMACDLADASETLINSADTAAALAPENFLHANEEETAALINADLTSQADATGALQPAASLDVAKAEQAAPDDLEVLETGATAAREDQPPLP
jgi:hypothetical protein